MMLLSNPRTSARFSRILSEPRSLKGNDKEFLSLSERTTGDIKEKSEANLSSSERQFSEGQPSSSISQRKSEFRAKAFSTPKEKPPAPPRFFSKVNHKIFCLSSSDNSLVAKIKSLEPSEEALSMTITLVTFEVWKKIALKHLSKSFFLL